MRSQLTDIILKEMTDHGKQTIRHRGMKILDLFFGWNLSPSILDLVLGISLETMVWSFERASIGLSKNEGKLSKYCMRLLPQDNATCISAVQKQYMNTLQKSWVNVYFENPTNELITNCKLNRWQACLDWWRTQNVPPVCSPEEVKEAHNAISVNESHNKIVCKQNELDF